MPQSAQDQTPDELKLVAHIRQKVDESRTNGSRVAHEAIWMTNIAYLLGFDSVYYDTNTRQYRTLGAQANRFLRRGRLRVNKILSRSQNRMSRLCKNPPKYDVRPNSNDAEDKDSARLGLEVINNIWDKQMVNKKRLDLTMWFQQCGYAFIKTCWDTNIGKPMLNPETGEMEPEGDVRIEIVSPFEVYVDPLAKSMEEVRWLVHAKVRKLDYFRETYELGYLVKEESAWLTSIQYEMRINNLSQQGGGEGGNTQAQMKNAAIELTYYEMPTKNHPNGRQCVTACGVLLEDKDLPIGEIPFAKFDDVLIAGKFQSESVITHARPIQDQFNRLITKRAEWTNRLLAGKFSAPRGHGINSEALTDQSGEVIEWNINPGAPNGGRPDYMQIPSIPQYAYVEEERLETMLDDIFGINEISRGQLPAAGIPAIGMSFLQEQDETRIGVVTENNEYSYAITASHILKYVGKYYIMPRMLKVAGDSLAYTVKEFTGKDLRDNFDVICIRGSTIPNSKTLKRQELINAYQQGFFGDPQDSKVRMKLLKMLEYGDIAEAWEDQALDERQAKDQIEMIERGEIPPRNEFDNHEWHLIAKNRFRKSDKYKVLDEVKKNILMQDLEYHIAALTDIANPQLKQDQEMAGHLQDVASEIPDQLSPQDEVAAEEQQAQADLQASSPQQNMGA